VNLLILRKKQETKEYTSDSSGVPDFSLNDDNKAGNILNRYFVRVSPATDGIPLNSWICIFVDSLL
jgi:hypothetical protein